MELKYDISKFIAASKMSSKIRVLVEGKDDRGHILNLLNLLAPKARLKVDIAVDILGDCKLTANNNRAKIEKIHEQCKDDESHRKLFFLCDREFRNFVISGAVEDNSSDHEVDGNMSWTLGHSIENYFLSPQMLSEGFMFLSGSGNKRRAVELFCSIFEDSLRKIAAATLAAKVLGCANYPASLVKWHTISISGELVDFDLGSETPENAFMNTFIAKYDELLSIANRTDIATCERFCRGHTAVVMLQRLFAACLYHVAKNEDEEMARYDANIFNNVPEASISSALSEAWIRRVQDGLAYYPRPLVDLVVAVA